MNLSWQEACMIVSLRNRKRNKLQSQEKKLRKKIVDTNRVMFKWDIENLRFHKTLLMSWYDFPEAEVPSST